jgi:hypothetical protein
MTSRAADEIYEDIVHHMNKKRAPYYSWYVGITSDWVNRLFNAHQVPRKWHSYIVRQCLNVTDARAVRDALHKLGCAGQPDEGDQDTVYVYAYYMTCRTLP